MVNGTTTNLAPRNIKDARDRILKTFDEMIGRCVGEGKNPYTVNVISYSGHGITYEGDAVAVIPDNINGQN